MDLAAAMRSFRLTAERRSNRDSIVDEGEEMGGRGSRGEEMAIAGEERRWRE